MVCYVVGVDAGLVGFVSKDGHDVWKWWLLNIYVVVNVFFEVV